MFIDYDDDDDYGDNDHGDDHDDDDDDGDDDGVELSIKRINDLLPWVWSRFLLRRQFPDW